MPCALTLKHLQLAKVNEATFLKLGPRLQATISAQSTDVYLPSPKSNRHSVLSSVFYFVFEN